MNDLEVGDVVTVPHILSPTMVVWYIDEDYVETFWFNNMGEHQEARFSKSSLEKVK